MSDYIEREAAEEVFRNARKSLNAKKYDYMANEYLTRDTMLLNAEQIIHALPTAAVREVVTCGECIHLNREKSNTNGFYRCDRYDAWQDENDRVHMPLDGFCSYGDSGTKREG